MTHQFVASSVVFQLVRDMGEREREKESVGSGPVLRVARKLQKKVYSIQNQDLVSLVRRLVLDFNWEFLVLGTERKTNT